MALDSPKVVGGGAFVSPFEWNENSTVIIKYKHGGGHIRAHPHNHELCDHKGGQTEWAKWKVHLSDNGRIAQLEHVKTHKYLQMDKFLTSINVASEGGSSSRWIVHPMGSNCVRLESERNEGNFLGVKPHDGVTIVNGTNLDENSYPFQFTYLYFFIEGQKDEGYFKKPYLMKQQNTIIIRHPQNGTLRTNPNDERELDINGQKEMNARWEAIVTMMDSNDIKTNTNSNSNSNTNTNSSSNSSDINITNNSSENLNENNDNTNNNNNSNDNNSNDNSNEKDTTTTNGTSNEKDTTNDNNKNENSKNTTEDTTNEDENKRDDNNSNDNNNNSDKKEENGNDNDSNAKNNENKDDDSDEFDDSHEKTNIVLQFRSVKSGGFIKLDDNKITMSRKGDDFTKFRVYIVEHPHIVKLESTKHPGSYIRVNTKRGIHVGKGGPHCQMTLLRME